MRIRLPAGQRLYFFETIDSTNAEAQRLAAAGETGPAWIWALRQDRGRGRQCRRWISEPGNLYATYLFTVATSPAQAMQVGFVAALAVREMAAELAGGGDQLTLKWPNDVLLDGAKVSGILTETAGQYAVNRLTLALGCGVNLAHAPEGMPYPVTSLSRYGVTVTAAQALESLSRVLERWLSIWSAGAGFPRIRQAWLAHAVGLGEPVFAGPDLHGIFTGLGADGALILTLPTGATHDVHSGEVRLAGLERLRARAQ